MGHLVDQRCGDRSPEYDPTGCTCKKPTGHLGSHDCGHVAWGNPNGNADSRPLSATLTGQEPVASVPGRTEAPGASEGRACGYDLRHIAHRWMDALGDPEVTFLCPGVEASPDPLESARGQVATLEANNALLRRQRNDAQAERDAARADLAKWCSLRGVVIGMDGTIRPIDMDPA